MAFCVERSSSGSLFPHLFSANVSHTVVRLYLCLAGIFVGDFPDFLFPSFLLVTKDPFSPQHVTSLSSLSLLSCLTVLQLSFQCSTVKNRSWCTLGLGSSVSSNGFSFYFFLFLSFPSSLTSSSLFLQVCGTPSSLCNVHDAGTSCLSFHSWIRPASQTVFLSPTRIVSHFNSLSAVAPPGI